MNQCNLLQSDMSVSQYCVTIKRFNHTSLSQYCVTISSMNQCDLLQSDKSVSQYCVTIKRFNQTNLSQYCVTISSMNQCDLLQSDMSVSQSALCDNQTHLYPHTYSTPAMRYRLHLHVNALQLKTYAIKKSCCLSLSLLSKYYWLGVTNLKTLRTALCRTYKWRLGVETY
jgi:hypothetical protein